MVVVILLRYRYKYTQKGICPFWYRCKHIQSRASFKIMQQFVDVGFGHSKPWGKKQSLGIRALYPQGTKIPLGFGLWRQNGHYQAWTVRGTGTLHKPASRITRAVGGHRFFPGIGMGIKDARCPKLTASSVNMHTIHCLRNIGVTRPHHYISSSCLDWRGTLEPSSMACWSSFWSIWPFSSSEATSTSGLDLEQQQEQHRLKRM